MESVTGPLPRHRHRAADDASAIPRSTVGTVTEIYDHLRVLFAALGRPHCPRCERARRRADRRADRGAALRHRRRGARSSVLAPVVRGRKGAFRKELAALRAAGLPPRPRGRARASDLDEPLPSIPAATTASRCSSTAWPCGPGAEKRLRRRPGARRCDLARRRGAGRRRASEERLYSRRLACVALRRLGAPSCRPRAFSFNSPYGACPGCEGLGWRWDVDAGQGDPRPERARSSTAPSTPGSATARGWCARRWRTWPRRHGFSLEQPVARAAAPGAGRPLLHGRRRGFPGVLPHLRRRAETLLRAGARRDGRRPRRRRGLRGPAPLPERDRLPGLPRRAPAAGEPGRAPGRALHRGLRAAHRRRRRVPALRALAFAGARAAGGGPAPAARSSTRLRVPGARWASAT